MSKILSVEVGLRLKKRRELLRLSASEVARIFNISRARIDSIENGAIEGNYQEIYALICLYNAPTHEIFAGYFDRNKSCLAKLLGV